MPNLLRGAVCGCERTVIYKLQRTPQLYLLDATRGLMDSAPIPSIPMRSDGHTVERSAICARAFNKTENLQTVDFTRSNLLYKLYMFPEPTLF